MLIIIAWVMLVAFDRACAKRHGPEWESTNPLEPVLETWPKHAVQRHSDRRAFARLRGILWRCTIALVLVWTLVFASYRTADARADAALAVTCPERLSPDGLRECLQRPHETYLEASGDAAGRGALMWVLVVL